MSICCNVTFCCVSGTVCYPQLDLRKCSFALTVFQSVIGNAEPFLYQPQNLQDKLVIRRNTRRSASINSPASNVYFEGKLKSQNKFDAMNSLTMCRIINIARLSSRESN